MRRIVCRYGALISACVSQDEVQLGLEIIMMVWCFYEISAIARRFISAILVGWHDKPDPKLKDEILPGLKTLLCDFW